VRTPHFHRLSTMPSFQHPLDDASGRTETIVETTERGVRSNVEDQQWQAGQPLVSAPPREEEKTAAVFATRRRRGGGNVPSPPLPPSPPRRRCRNRDKEGPLLPVRASRPSVGHEKVMVRGRADMTTPMDGKQPVVAAPSHIRCFFLVNQIRSDTIRYDTIRSDQIRSDKIR
jgi:hypothetical protein